MAIHAGIFTLIAASMYTQKAGGKVRSDILISQSIDSCVLAYGVLQFSMDIMVMFVIVALCVLPIFFYP